MKKTILLIIFFFSSLFCMFAQNQLKIDAIVFDRFEQKTIPYADIGIRGKDWGAIADADGFFKIKLQNEILEKTDTLVISSIGYYDWVIPVTNLEQYFDKRAFVLLTPKEKKSTAKVEKFNNRKILGGISKNLYAEVPLNEVLINGSELASLIKIPYDEAIIEKVFFEVSKNTTDSVQLRLNIYDVKEGLPNRPILKKAINHWVSIREGRDSINISTQNIKINGNVVVSFQLLETIGGSSDIRLAMSNNGNTVFSRYFSQSNWITYPAVGMSYALQVAYTEGNTKLGENLDEIGGKDSDPMVTGKISMEGKPIPGVRVKIKGSLDEVETNSNGEYAIKANYGDILETDFFTLKPEFAKVSENTVINFELQPKYEQLDEVVLTESKLDDKGREEVITPFGIMTRNSISAAGYFRTKDELAIGAASLGQLVRGQIPGLTVSGSLNEERFLGRGSAPVAVIIDGILLNTEFQSASAILPPERVENILFIPGVSASARFGQVARNGAIAFTTKNNPLLAEKKKRDIESTMNSNIYGEDALPLAEDNLTFSSASDKTDAFTLTGKVTSKGEPFQGVLIGVEGSLTQVETNVNGEYAINVKIGDVLTTNFFTLESKKILVEALGILNIELKPKYTELNKVTVTEKKLENAGEEELETSLGRKKHRSLGYGVTTKNAEDLSKSATSLGRYLAGQFPGLIVSGFIGEETYQIRGETSLLFQSPPLFVVDDVPFTTPPNFLDPNTIASATVINGLSGTTRYGSLGRGGVIIIKTKLSSNDTATNNGTKKPLLLLQGNDYDGTLSTVKNVAVASAIKNLGESNTNISLLKTKAMFYESEGLYESSLKFYKQIAVLRPDRIQSYLDIARTLVKTGEYEIAFGLYKQMLSGQILGASLDSDIIQTIAIEVRHLATKHKSSIPFRELPSAFLEKALNINTRIVFDWNVAAAPFEVQFVNPDKKYDIWKHTYEENEDRLLRETEYGYQTEQFLIENTQKGTWLVNIENKSLDEDNRFPVFLKCTVYRNYGTPNETFISKMVELTKLAQKVNLLEIEN